MSRIKPFTIDQAWSRAMKADGSQSVVDLAGGGYAVPVEKTREIKPPSRTKPILAYVNGGVVSILPTSTHGIWKIVA